MRRAITYHRGTASGVLLTLLPSEKLKPDRRRVLYIVAVIDLHEQRAAVLANHVPLREARALLAAHWGITTAELEHPNP